MRAIFGRRYLFYTCRYIGWGLCPIASQSITYTKVGIFVLIPDSIHWCRVESGINTEISNLCIYIHTHTHTHTHTQDDALLKSWLCLYNGINLAWKPIACRLHSPPYELVCVVHAYKDNRHILDWAAFPATLISLAHAFEEGTHDLYRGTGSPHATDFHARMNLSSETLQRLELVPNTYTCIYKGWKFLC